MSDYTVPETTGILDNRIELLLSLHDFRSLPHPRRLSTSTVEHSIGRMLEAGSPQKNPAQVLERQH